MEIQEKTIWWAIVTLCTLPQLAGIINPLLATHPSFVRIQLFALSAIISIAVSASVIRSPLHGKTEGTRHTTVSNLFRKPKRVSIIGYKVYYRIQKRVAIIFSFIILIVSAFLFSKDKLEGELFSFLLPISLIGPVLYLRDRFKGKDSKALQKEKPA